MPDQSHPETVPSTRRPLGNGHTRADMARAAISEAFDMTDPVAVNRTWLRIEYESALVTNFHERAAAKIVASPEEHCEAAAQAVMAVRDTRMEALITERDALGAEADRLRTDYVAMRTRAETAERKLTTPTTPVR